MALVVWGGRLRKECWMEFRNATCSEFAEKLNSKEPVPGGGGASALVGALASALGGMVASLTIGKKKYADVEEIMVSYKEQSLELQRQLLELIDEDARVFAPLAKAYGLPSGTEAEAAEKDRIMEGCLREACSVPQRIVELSCRVIELQKEFAKKGSRLAVSDAGVGAAFGMAALQGAALNVYINTKAMKDRDYAEKLNCKVQQAVETYSRMAEEIYQEVTGQLMV